MNTQTFRQLDFGHARAQARGPQRPSHAARLREHAGQLVAVVRNTESEHPLRAAALDRMKRSLVEFVKARGVGAKLQAGDFTRWLDDTGARPDPAVLAPQASGGMFKHLTTCGILAVVGFEPTGEYGGSNSTRRSVYRVESLDFARLHWPCLGKAVAA
ncbi:MAG: hypothetical protein KDA05_12320 [Phycisphaerales bacterium]|nr:hypothetical protein [Phycisphaerales bacterium]